MALTAEEQVYIEQLYDDLIKSAKRLKTEEDIAFIRKAFELANKAHSKMRRKMENTNRWYSHLKRPLCSMRHVNCGVITIGRKIPIPMPRSMIFGNISKDVTKKEK